MTHALLKSPDQTPASDFAFGTMQFGDKASDRDSEEMFDACLEAGITHFDTAYVYSDGASERLLGVLAKPHRDRLVIATKVNYDGPSDARNITESFEASRLRLQMDMVDVLYLHRFDPDTDMHESFGALAKLRDAGLCRYVGVSNFAAWQVMKAQAIAAKFGLGIDILQPMYNLLKRQAEVEILPMCADQSIEIAPYSPLAGGLLSGKYAQAGTTGRLNENKMYEARYRPEWMHAAANALVEVAADLGVAPATLAAAWVARHPARPKPILSGRTVAQLVPSLAAMSYTMSDEVYARLSALTPTPPPATDRLEEAS